MNDKFFQKVIQERADELESNGWHISNERNVHEVYTEAEILIFKMRHDQHTNGKWRFIPVQLFDVVDGEVVDDAPSDQAQVKSTARLQSEMQSMGADSVVVGDTCYYLAADDGTETLPQQWHQPMQEDEWQTAREWLALLGYLLQFVLVVLVLAIIFIVAYFGS